MSAVLSEIREGVHYLTMNRPETHNAQNVEMLRELDDALAAVDRDDAARAVVLSGAGKSFCSGHDLREMSVNAEYAENATTAEGRFYQEQRLFVGPVQRFRDLRVPTICRVQGHCIAAGLMFVASADFVVAATDATFRSPIIAHLGVNDAEVPALAWRIGEARAKRMLWLDETLTAKDALEAGLVGWVVHPDELDATVTGLVGRLVAMPRHALALSKDTFSFMAERQGRRDVDRYHFATHQLSHHTAESRTILLERLERIAQGGSPVPGAQRR